MRLKYLALLALLTGCSSQEVASDRTISNAVENYLDQEGGALCLNLQQWPFDLDREDLRLVERFPHGIASKMKTLQQIGLVSSQEVKLGGVDFSGQPNVGKRYQLTKLGEKYLLEKPISPEDKTSKSDLCFAHKTLDKLVKWEPEANTTLVVNAHYTYQVKNVANWAKSAEFKTVFSDEATATFSPQPEQQRVVKSDGEWQVQSGSV